MRPDAPGLHAQALAPLRAAASEHLTSGARGHSCTKPVRALTMQFARLVSTLHAGSRREKCAKTSTWWGKKKGGKGTQQSWGCQAWSDQFRRSLSCPAERFPTARRHPHDVLPRRLHRSSRPVDNPRRIGIDSPALASSRASNFSLLHQGTKPCRVRYGGAV